MANTYKYTILTAVPDARRGERVNVGIVVFRDDYLDVRFRQASSKLKALTGATWESRIQALQERIKMFFERGTPAETIFNKIQNLDPIISSVGLGSMNTIGPEDYDQAIEEILSMLVVPPRQKRAETQSRINTEIARVFRDAKVLAKPHASIMDRKIVRDLPVAPNEGLTADFALQNGMMHIASTLDLRKQNASIAEAALKSIVLDKSGDVWGKSIRKIGVYAVLPDMKQQFKHHIELLTDYADETYNWIEPDDHRKFLRTMYDALPPAFFNNRVAE
jgi:hypothetical protein